MSLRVVAGLLWEDGRVLVCQRREEGLFPLKWEFPGGKVEDGEDHLTALQRELREELGVETCSAREIFRTVHAYPNWREVELVFFHVNGYQGRVSNRAFQRLLWAEPKELAALDFLEGDLPLVEKLRRREIVM